MPKNLLAAHRVLDRETDALHGRGAFDEVKRLAALLRRYRDMTGEAGVSRLPWPVTRMSRSSSLVTTGCRLSG